MKAAFKQHKLVFCGSLQSLSDANQFRRFLNQLHRKDWVVYAKPPFGGPEHVLHNLARHTHRIAIGNHRLLSFDGSKMSFRWKDYANGNIRHFGFLANRHRTSLLALCRTLIGEEQLLPPCAGTTKLQVRANWPCPSCSHAMTVVEGRSAAQALRYIAQTASLDSS